MVDGKQYYIGNMTWIQSKTGKMHVPDNLSSTPAGDCTTVWVGIEGAGIIGRIALNDTLREDVQDVVRRLDIMGMKTVLLSGDDQPIVQRMADGAGIKEAYGGIKPEEKASFISRLQAENKCVAMVGDGVNDSIALSAADVGIALRSGTDAAGEAADVVLMGDRLSQVLDAIHLGRETLKKIKQNLGLAVIYNTFGIPVAAGALIPSFGIALSPAVAAGMMALSSIGVVGNSLFLRQTLLKESKDN